MRPGDQFVHGPVDIHLVSKNVASTSFAPVLRFAGHVLVTEQSVEEELFRGTRSA